MKLGVSYWHGFGTTIPDGEFLGGVWMLVITGPHETAVPAEYEIELERYSIPWVQSWNHQPTEEEKVALEPPDIP